MIGAGMLLAGWMATLPAWGQEAGRKDGWYHVTEGKNDSLEAMPFIGLDDIAALQPDKDGNGRYVILGQVKEEKTDTWADETEKAIGRKIAFVFNDSVLTAPMVNARIASGRFLITGPDSKGLEAIYQRIMQKMEPSQIDLAREDSLRRATEQRLWQEARQYRATLTDTTYLDTRGPMSLRCGHQLRHDSHPAVLLAQLRQELCPVQERRTSEVSTAGNNFAPLFCLPTINIG